MAELYKETGHFTYQSSLGTSMIDYALFDHSTVGIIVDFLVQELSGFV